MTNIVVGDIDGTNVRLGLTSGAGLEHPTSYRVRDHKSLPDVLAAYRASLPTDKQQWTDMVLGVPAEVHSDTIDIKKNNWQVSASGLRSTFNVQRALLVNDFVAYGCAAALCDVNGQTGLDVDCIKPSANEANVIPSAKTKVVIGPGTGLDVAVVTNVSEPVVHACEGGVIPFPFASNSDLREISEFMLSQAGVWRGPTFQDFASGPGIVLIYKALIAKKMYKEGLIEKPTPEKLYEHALTDTQFLRSPAAERAFQISAQALGMFASSMTSMHTPRGGIYIAGGVSKPLFEIPGTKEAFLAGYSFGSPLHKNLRAAVPVYRFKDPQSVGLRGLAGMATTLLRQRE
jgi:glucokinase